MGIVTALLAGLVFGCGLLLSGMADPAKVLGFLDLAGAWDPSLALVMGGAIAVALPAFGVAKRQKRTVFDTPVALPPPTPVDARLVGGSVVFGIGWGLVGFCPGPAVVALGLGERSAWLFVAAMLAGMALFEGLQRRAASRSNVEV
jgi:uncharacterized membrane protein YedE/YeeE